MDAIRFLTDFKVGDSEILNNLKRRLELSTNEKPLVSYNEFMAKRKLLERSSNPDTNNFVVKHFVSRIKSLMQYPSYAGELPKGIGNFLEPTNPDVQNFNDLSKYLDHYTESKVGRKVAWLRGSIVPYVTAAKDIKEAIIKRFEDGDVDAAAQRILEIMQRKKTAGKFKSRFF